MTTKLKNDPRWYDALTNPWVLLALGALYVILAVAAAGAADRSSLWFHSYNMVVFPLLVVSPMVFVSLPIPNSFKVGAIAFLLLILMPIIGFLNSSYLDTVVQICIYTCFALGLNVVVGYAGLLDLGYVAFFATGAYLWGMFTSNANTFWTINGYTVSASSFYFFLIIGLVIAAIVGILLGLPVLRLRGDYLAIVTLGFGEVFRILAQNLDKPKEFNFTNGALGLQNVAQPPAEFLVGAVKGVMTLTNRVGDKPETIAQNLLIYMISLGILMLVILISQRMENSPIGRAWTAIREDEVAAVAMGVPKLGMKLRAFAFGAAFGGMMGVLFSAKMQFISPDSFKLTVSIGILAMVIIGGLGSIKGVIFGAMVVKLIELHILTSLSLQINALKNANFIVPIVNFPMGQLSPELDPTKFKPLIFGVILVFMMLFRPAGLIPAQRRRLELEEEDTVDLPQPVKTAS